MTETFYLTYDAENRLVEASTVQRSAYEDWDYKKAVTLTYSGSTLTDYDVLIEMDTASLITAGKMKAECEDLRVTDSDGETQLDYWIEGGCNTSSTQIWVRVPSIPDGGKTLYVYYGNSSAESEEESWSGNFIMLYNSSCPTGWTEVTALNERFPQGSSSYGGTGGSASHDHGTASCTTGTSAGSTTTRIGTGGLQIAISHTHTDARVDVDTNSSVQPPYLEMVFCQSPDLEIDSGLIALFDSSAPSSWTRFTALDSRMPRGASSYGGTGGSTTHTHTTTGGYNTSTVTGTTRKSGATASAGDHYHTTVAGNTDSANNLPPYLDMVFASIDSDGVGIASSIVIVSAVPPLGWSRFSSLDGNFPRGASSYGGTGGASSHTHSITIETGPPSSTSTAGGGLVDTATSTHTHSCTDITDSQSNLPAYMDVIFAKRDNPAASTSVGTEESNGGGGSGAGNDTFTYVYNADGARVIEVVSNTQVITTVYIGNYYEYTISGTESITKSYYYAGATRVAMRDGGTLYFLLYDHLGSTSLMVEDDESTVYAEQRYKPWGSVRYTRGTMVTDFGFTGQRSEVQSFGLMYYGGRFYDPSLGRFSQSDILTLRPPTEQDNTLLSNIFIALTVDFHNIDFVNYVNYLNRRNLFENRNPYDEYKEQIYEQNVFNDPEMNLAKLLKQVNPILLNSGEFSLRDINLPSQIGRFQNSSANNSSKGKNKEILEDRNTTLLESYQSNNLDRYSYVKSCPTRYTDPSGYITKECIGEIIGGIITLETATVVTFGGVILTGGTFVIGGVTLGLSVPPSVPVVVVGIAMEVIATGMYIAGTAMVIDGALCEESSNENVKQ